MWGSWNKKGEICRTIIGKELSGEFTTIVSEIYDVLGLGLSYTHIRINLDVQGVYRILS